MSRGRLTLGGLNPGPIRFIYFCTLMRLTLSVNMTYYCLVNVVDFKNFHKLNHSMNNFQFVLFFT